MRLVFDPGVTRPEVAGAVERGKMAARGAVGVGLSLRARAARARAAAMLVRAFGDRSSYLDRGGGVPHLGAEVPVRESGEVRERCESEGGVWKEAAGEETGMSRSIFRASEHRPW